MSALRFKFFLRNTAVRRFWNTWTRNYLINTVVRKFRRERGVREVIQCFKQVIFRPRRTLLLTATAVCKGRDKVFPCEQGISDNELQELLEEMEGLEKLAKLTVYCTSCGKRLVIDKKQNGVSYCVCKDSKPSQESLDGWVPYMEAVDVIIWRKEYKPGTGQYAYKVYGRYPEVSASDYAAVQIDGAYRKAWDSAVAALSVVQRGAHGMADQAVMHWEVLWPRLFANRDYVYIRRHKEVELTSPKKYEFTSVHAKAKRKYDEGTSERDGNKVYIILSKACEHPDVPETKHAIRVTEYWSHMVVKSTHGADKPGMEFVLTYYDEPAVGGMPGGVAAWASSRAAPDYLLKMRKAATDYKGWADRRGKLDLPDFTPFGPDQVSFEENVEQINEQDMESSKLGPDLECDMEKKDKETQTDRTDDKIVKSEETANTENNEKVEQNVDDKVEAQIEEPGEPENTESVKPSEPGKSEVEKGEKNSEEQQQTEVN
ncbi:stAR-related lipid transfer protein 7, mitochondrial isoform X2 [Pieris brassicae]|uniref:stAR-related lipid transfer protein 7, mitochondrial isoform X2 n=1 Tax=Pieris brassicae TaxID=7116 RepID=UPI001E65EC78|nr:stAR-related lipid transfer protein 7, mitochondrial isoform X2 [Pieris brassicae]